MTTTADAPSISAKDLNAFPTKVRKAIAELVNTYQVKYRMPDGGHILLYSPDPQVRPYKISAARAGETSMQFLEKWAARQIPNWGKEPEKQLSKDPVDIPKPGPLAKPKKDREPKLENLGQRNWLVFRDGRKSEFLFWEGETDESLLLCTQDDWRSKVRRGAHLHEAIHTGKAQERAEKAAATRKAQREGTPEEKPEAAVVTPEEPTEEPSTTETVLDRARDLVERQAEESKVEEPVVEEPKAEEPAPEPPVAPVIPETPHEVDLPGAAKLLAEHFGLKVSTVSEEEAADLRRQIQDQFTQITTLINERDELAAQLALIREALSL